MCEAEGVFSRWVNVEFDKASGRMGSGRKTDAIDKSGGR